VKICGNLNKDMFKVKYHSKFWGDFIF